jgi:Flp pilus assembly protein TadD
MLYERTDYTGSLRVLENIPAPDAESLELSGKNHYMLGDYHRAQEAFEKAAGLNPANSDYALWLGRTYGRRAETGNRLFAAPNALHARQWFEKAVALDPKNAEALNDLFDYYLNAPSILGGGIEKAEAIANRIANERPAEYQFEQAQLAEHRHQYAEAETHLRHAMELAPAQVGRVLDLAGFLAKRKQFAESDALFARAARHSPATPRVAFAHARALIEAHRDPDQARVLLRQYLSASLTPDDPPKQAAEKLLKQLG